jgi:hypothetical protein
MRLNHEQLKIARIYALHDYVFKKCLYVCILNELYQGRPNGRSRTISESIMLEFIFRPRAQQLIVVVMNKLSISFTCKVFIFYSGL